MNETNILEMLRDIAFLREVEDEYLEQIAAMAKIVDFPEGKLIFREGEPASEIYLIISGSVSLEVNAPGIGCKRILTIDQGDLLGWTPILEQTRLSATARALSSTRAVAIDGGQILTLCVHNPRFGYEFMRQVALELARRLSATRMQLLDVYGSQMPTVDEPSEE